MSNNTPNRNSEIPLELKKYLNSLTIRKERKKWKLAINASFTVLTILVTIAINAVAKIFNNDKYINKFVLILNCIVFGIQAFTIISVPVNEGIYVLPASVTISWIVVGVLGSNLFLQAFEYFLE
ncbi:17317_t:CDS:2 [Gigaspora rosea]|nr:17317_t:CDS:2 [Gigaspora rosea]